jgi:hypothetical protein
MEGAGSKLSEAVASLSQTLSSIDPRAVDGAFERLVDRQREGLQEMRQLLNGLRHGEARGEDGQPSYDNSGGTTAVPDGFKRGGALQLVEEGVRVRGWLLDALADAWPQLSEISSEWVATEQLWRELLPLPSGVQQEPLPIGSGSGKSGSGGKSPSSDLGRRPTH